MLRPAPIASRASTPVAYPTPFRPRPQRVGERLAAPRRHARDGNAKGGAADRELLVDLGLGEAMFDRAALLLLDERQRLFPRAFPGDRAYGDLIEYLPARRVAEIAGETRRILGERDPLGRASCREGVCQYVSILGVGVS